MIFKNSIGHWLTRSLFQEFDKSAPYSWDELRESFLTIGDPTCYKFAITHFASWAHFEHLMKQPWFSKRIDEWKQELDVKLQAEGLTSIVNEVRTEGKSAFQAAKFLVNKDWIAQPQAKRGRPSSEEVKGHLKEVARIDSEVEDDAARILN